MSEDKKKIIIVGAGIAGLSTGVFLKKTGKFDVLFIEANDRVGGRIKTEKINGYLLDYGFHIFFTANPIAAELLDIEKLDLRYFKSGALIMKNHSYQKFYDPFKHPKYFFKSLFSKIGNLNDKINIVKRRFELTNMSYEKVFDKYEVKTSSILKKRRFSSKIIKNLFNPIFSHFFMENELSTSRRMFEFYLKMLADGNMAIPAKGIEEITKQLFSNFDKSEFMFNTKAVNIEEDRILLENGESLKADAFVIATDYNGLYSKIIKSHIENKQRSITCFYFSANKSPFKEKLICFNANENKIVSSVAVLSNISQNYAPIGKSLIVATIIDKTNEDENELELKIKDEVSNVFGSQVYDWEKIKCYKIYNAISNQDYVLGKRRENEINPKENIFFCGDHLLNGTIYGAMKSAKNISEMILKNLIPKSKDRKRSK
ncbi:MAG: FAD-dependent oxidoreductase [Bacteroidia bacterium]|nr:FAD-dependent oxidoreductase [Bacteroidia bacterium]